jgi:hypothetical protein
MLEPIHLSDSEKEGASTVQEQLQAQSEVQEYSVVGKK